MSDDPMERKIEDALKGAGIGYTADPRLTLGLDFKLSALPIYIEIKRMHSDRIAGQMARADNVIAVQGKKAVEWMAAIILESTNPPDLDWKARAEAAEARLKDIGDFAHDRSTGPTIPDDLWEVRRMAYDL